jgi:hypothetical protein
MFGWFKGLEMTAKLGIGFLVSVLAISIFMGVRGALISGLDRAEQKGGTAVRADTAEKGMKHVENANRAAANVRADPVVRNAECVRDSRTPENC